MQSENAEVDMTSNASREVNAAVLDAGDFQSLLDALTSQGYVAIGPALGQGAITLDRIAAVDDMPRGYVDLQEPGRYKLDKTGEDEFFDYVVGPHSWKKYLHPPKRTVWQAQRKGSQVDISEPTEAGEKYAFIGVRPCELQAITIQDRVFLEGPYVDTDYKRRRDGIFLVAVNCVHPGGTCFCTSMKTGPRASSSFDICLTEIVEANRHYFVIESCSDEGRQLMQRLSLSATTDHELKSQDRVMEEAADSIDKSIDTGKLKELLYSNFDSPQWEDIAGRCLTCGSCTMVCPTCFCATIEDSTDLSGSKIERSAKWDSCHTLDHSYIHGGSVRTSASSRYRQWMTHKLAYWVDQFGTSGCVGCGRCITWCPAAIDITEEARLMREQV